MKWLFYYVNKSKIFFSFCWLKDFGDKIPFTFHCILLRIGLKIKASFGQLNYGGFLTPLHILTVRLWKSNSLDSSRSECLFHLLKINRVSIDITLLLFLKVEASDEDYQSNKRQKTLNDVLNEGRNNSSYHPTMGHVVAICHARIPFIQIREEVNTQWCKALWYDVIFHETCPTTLKQNLSKLLQRF